MRDNANANEMMRSAAFALCPLDGRYVEISEKLANYFSEFALVKYRVHVEFSWLFFILKKTLNIVNNEEEEKLLELEKSVSDFSFDDFNVVKEIEAKTRHDVKACELYVVERLKQCGLEKYVSFVHIGCTSEDITNVAYAMMLADALENAWIPNAYKLITTISQLAEEYANTPMLAHTHGQPATPTTVGKEMNVYVHRFSNALEHINDIDIYAKFNGATGNYSAISVAYPNINWPEKCEEFIENSFAHHGLKFNPITTQIENHDYVCCILDEMKHFNNILRDFDLDMWLYISKEYFKQIAVKGEVGSSTMPHKINPIRFENSEANIKIGNAICSAISDELPRSRMQRDLSDSSLQRNIGMAFGYSLQAIEQTIGGLAKVQVNKAKLEEDLNDRWEVLAEPIQTMLRKYCIPDAYDRLKELTRGKKISKEDIQNFIESLDMLSAEDKKTLLELTPVKYIGWAPDIALHDTLPF